MKEYIVAFTDDAYFERFVMIYGTSGELIRCKDCVYFTSEKSGEHWNVCRFYDAPKTADGFCNDAEREESEA